MCIPDSFHRVTTCELGTTRGQWQYLDHGAHYTFGGFRQLSQHFTALEILWSGWGRRSARWIGWGVRRDRVSVTRGVWKDQVCDVGNREYIMVFLSELREARTSGRLWERIESTRSYIDQQNKQLLADRRDENPTAWSAKSWLFVLH